MLLQKGRKPLVHMKMFLEGDSQSKRSQAGSSHPYHRQLHIAEPKSAVVQETLKTTTNSVETGHLSKCLFHEEAIMRYIMMDEDDISICEQTLNPEHFNYYQKNKSGVQEMVNQQPVGFWVRYITSLRSKLYKIGLIPRQDWRAVHAEETYITLLNLMSDTNTGRRANKIKELMGDIRSFYRYNFYVTEQHILPLLAWKFPDVKPSLDRLFGRAEDIPYKFVKFLVWTRFSGGLVMIHKRWKKAKSVSALTDMPWKAPVQWYNFSKVHRVHLFEEALKKKWGDELAELVGFQHAIPWWHAVEEIAMVKTVKLPKIYPLETSSLGFHFVHPVSSDDDDDDEKEAESVDTPAGKPSQAQRSVAGASKESDQAIQDGLRLCAYCNKVEPAPNTYKRCKLCVDEASPDEKHYCSKECQVNDWKKGHKYHH
ncbi:uncharacterized protein [Periplaneta americana]|uniref:uncharacterized protein n=1 Tax=Periplaneta americana TaxID=6978 RepID=UPI0037E8677F